MYWSGKAELCDRWSRTAIPSAYFLCLILLFNLDLTDPYAGDAHGGGDAAHGAHEGRIRGLGPFSVHSSGVVGALVYLGAALLAALASMQLLRRAERSGEREQAGFREASRASVETRAEDLIRRGEATPDKAMRDDDEEATGASNRYSSGMGTQRRPAPGLGSHTKPANGMQPPERPAEQSRAADYAMGAASLPVASRASPPPDSPPVRPAAPRSLPPVVAGSNGTPSVRRSPFALLASGEAKVGPV